jgi:uncharacterized LabA/DUF88 family protein
MSGANRVIFYVDGFNFYFGLKSKGWRKYFWLDCVSFFSKFLRSHQQLIEVNYFSARPFGEDKRRKQEAFFSCNKDNSQFHLYLGKFLRKKVICRKCGDTHFTYEEKETDVDIAVKMINDVVLDRCDITILVSADSDIIPPINFIKEFKPLHKIFVYFPPNRFSYDLKGKAHRDVKLENHEAKFQDSLLDSPFILKNGTELTKPSSWS